VLVAAEAATEAVSSVGVVKHFGIEFEAKKGEVRRVTFVFSDVERAKLEPVLDFKGKKR
jgi:ribosome maturation factor RimP